MGAVAITTLAGSRLMLASPEVRLLGEVLPFIKGFTLFFWAAGTWWIPLLFILGYRRHVYKKFPLVYDPQYWGMVFPLGMYTAATFRLAEALPFADLELVARVFFPVAVVVWTATFVALCRRLSAGAPSP
jgi:tellurite resistance protein TehA-like permease